jgi:hypothetical protein
MTTHNISLNLAMNIMKKTTIQALILLKLSKVLRFKPFTFACLVEGDINTF